MQNREDHPTLGKELVNRLQDFSVMVLGENGQRSFGRNFTRTPYDRITFDAAGTATTGRYVRVTLNYKQSLSLAEVEVCGSKGKTTN